MSEEYEGQGRRRRNDDPLHTEKIVTDRKTFFLDLKENDRGRFVKITEDVRGRRDTIMVPEECLDDFIDALHDIADVNDGKEIDSKDDAPAAAAEGSGDDAEAKAEAPAADSDDAPDAEDDSDGGSDDDDDEKE